MKYFVLVYDQAEGKLVRQEEFRGVDLRSALDRRFELEHASRGEGAIEVVLLAAPDVDALKRTHARYFKTAQELAAAG